nr:MAG TPA: hypothetical protein [Caudoviricetes sp.]
MVSRICHYPIYYTQYTTDRKGREPIKCPPNPGPKGGTMYNKGRKTNEYKKR